MAALTNGYATYESEPRRSLLKEASTDSVFYTLPEHEVAKYSHPLLGKNGTVFHNTATTASEKRPGAAKECLGTNIHFEFLSDGMKIDTCMNSFCNFHSLSKWEESARLWKQCRRPHLQCER